VDSSDVEISNLAAEPTWLDPDNLRLRGKQRDNLSELILLLESRQGLSQALADCLLGRQSLISQPVESMRRLVAEVDAQSSKQSREAVLGILGRIVGEWNRAHRLKLPLPEFPVRMPKPVPPFTPRRWVGLAKYRTWTDAVLQDLVRSTSNQERGTSATSAVEAVQEDIAICVARVLVSAVLWGGLLCRKNLEQLYSSLSVWPEISECAHDRVYVTWFDEAKNCRRWMPDAITTLLMMRLKLEHQTEVAALAAEHRMESVVLRYFGSVLPDSPSIPNSLFEFIDSSLLHFELRLPRYLTEYAAGKLPSASPNPATWARMVRGKPQEIKTANIAETVSDEADSEDSDANPESPIDKGDDWVSELRRLLGSGDSALTPLEARKAIKMRLQNSRIDDVGRMFLSFAYDLLFEHKNGRLKTVRDSVIPVAIKLPAAVDLKKPGAIPPETLASAYSLLLEDSSTPSQRHKLRGYLRTWHNWLVRTGRSQRLDEAEVFGRGRQIQTVDANLIMEDEYIKARDSLVDWTMKFDEDANLEEDLHQIAGLILILGYRTGLRKSEVLKCPLDAVMVEPPAELLVRPWSERKLKTPNAVRKISLYALLDRPETKENEKTPGEKVVSGDSEKNELRLLRTWVRRRLLQNSRMANPSPYLFFTPALNRRFVPEGRIFPLIHETLREFTDDKTVHFHTCRKSGAGTWLAFALLKPPNVPLPKWLSTWPLQEARIEQVARLHRNLYLNDFATKRHLFAAARNLGHSSPGVSVQNYLELQGDLLGLWLDSVRPDLTATQVSAITGLSLREAYNLLSDPDQPQRKRYNKKTLYRNLWSLISRKWKKQISRTSTSTPSTSDLESDEPLSIHEKFLEGCPSELVEIQELLSAQSQGASKEDLLLRWGYPDSFINELLAIAEKAAELTVVEDTTQLHHGRPAYVHSFRKSESGKKCVCPIIPWTEQDVAIVTQFGPKIFESFQDRRAELLPIARHWLENRRDERQGLEFSIQEQNLAKQYADFLKEFTALRGRCSIRFFGSEDSVEKWKKFLPSPLWRRRKPARPPSPAKAVSNSIGIKVLLGAADKRKGGASQTSAFGWRYLMLLVSLWTMAWETTSPSNQGAHSQAEEPPQSEA
jgi:hypothetical protein